MEQACSRAGRSQVWLVELTRTTELFCSGGAGSSLGVRSSLGVGAGSAQVRRTNPKATQMPTNSGFIESQSRPHTVHFGRCSYPECDFWPAQRRSVPKRRDERCPRIE